MAPNSSLWSAPYNVTVKAGLQALEANWLPDVLLRQAIRFLFGLRFKISKRETCEEQLADLMKFIAGKSTGFVPPIKAYNVALWEW